MCELVDRVIQMEDGKLVGLYESKGAIRAFIQGGGKAGK
jgi:hypothetical protein